MQMTAISGLKRSSSQLKNWIWKRRWRLTVAEEFFLDYQGMMAGV
jgi:hypothetical protein